MAPACRARDSQGRRQKKEWREEEKHPRVFNVPSTSHSSPYKTLCHQSQKSTTASVILKGWERAPPNTHCRGTDWKFLSYSAGTNTTTPLTSQGWPRHVCCSIFRTSTPALSKALVQGARSNRVGTEEGQRLSGSRHLLISSCHPVRTIWIPHPLHSLHPEQGHFYYFIFWYSTWKFISKKREASAAYRKRKKERKKTTALTSLMNQAVKCSGSEQEFRAK